LSRRYFCSLGEVILFREKMGYMWMISLWSVGAIPIPQLFIVAFVAALGQNYWFSLFKIFHYFYCDLTE